jgi:ADP-ribose pyrophosphatase YjhB (NUDIX family)
MLSPHIKIKVRCLLIHESNVLVADANTFETTDERYMVPRDSYRLLGGSVEFGETAEDGIRREIREELQSEIVELEHIDVIEHIYIQNEAPHHEIVFLFTGHVANAAIFEQGVIHIEEESYAFDARWVPIEELVQGSLPIYPAYNYGALFENL